MPEPTSISGGLAANPGLDFEGLKQRGIEIIQQLSGDAWTDYNEHDPGVTTLEQVCYALTELSYQAELPVEALLADPATNRIDASRAALFRPDDVLPCAPVTANDWRRVLIDRVPGVGNAWIVPARPARTELVPGLWDFELYITDPHVATNVDRRRAAVRLARRTYLRYRGLCEDVVNVRVLRPATARLAATIAVAPSATPESVVARVFYETGQFLAPEVRRQPLDDVASHGVPPSQWLSGPRLLGGLIADDQLRPRPATVTLGDLTRILSQVEGVSGVHDVQLSTAFGRIDASEGSALAIPRRRILALDTYNHDGAFGIRLLANGVECRPDPVIVHSELGRLWSAHRRRHDTSARDDGALSGPAGPAAELPPYYSIQRQFPDVYGVNRHGVAPDASEPRRAQARQFKAYLLFFEQLLADELARLSSAKALFTTVRQKNRTADRYLDTSVPDVGPLLKPAYRSRLPELARCGDRALERRNRVLDLMLATCGEALGAFMPPAGVTGMALGQAQVRAKRALLRRLPWLGRRRGCGFDYAARLTRRGGTSFEVRSRIQLGMHPEPRPLAELLEEAGVRLVGTAPPAERAAMLRHARHIDAAFEPVPHVPDANGPRPGSPRIITEDLLLASGDLDAFRIGTLPGDETITVVCRTPSQPLWQLAGQYPDRDTALAGIADLFDAVDQIARHVRRLTVVEHTLLRFGRSQHHGELGDPELGESFAATAVVALPAREAADAAVRASVHNVLRAQAPAHVVVDVLFLRLSHASGFESLHAEWWRALRNRRGRELLSVCRRMREFLQSGSA